MRILLVEDNKEIIKFLKPCLEAENFVVDAAEDGAKGSFLARTNDYDLIILDYVLPKKDGACVCQEIRSRGKNMPIIMLSVKSEIEDKVKLLNIGADDYLTKPFSFEELLARIKALLRRPEKIENDILMVDDLVLDKNKQMVTRGKKEIYLTRKEFALLEYLMKNQGIVLSRGMIMEHVWDMNIDPFSNTVETHILNLRRKIEPKNASQLIHTISGRGYRIG
ncbi:transcriptional regulator [Parcubacteria bacterium DG_74_2]|nr:MAG: transcriptional regulator [Parcubacteria bacterium DG_74_2]